jgi:hypothetical protein
MQTKDLRNIRDMFVNFIRQLTKCISGEDQTDALL